MGRDLLGDGGDGWRERRGRVGVLRVRREPRDRAIELLGPVRLLMGRDLLGDGGRGERRRREESLDFGVRRKPLLAVRRRLRPVGLLVSGGLLGDRGPARGRSDPDLAGLKPSGLGIDVSGD